MAQLDSEVRASTTQESPDTVFLAGHFRLHYQPLGEHTPQTILPWGMPTESKGLELPPFDLPTVGA